MKVVSAPSLVPSLRWNLLTSLGAFTSTCLAIGFTPIAALQLVGLASLLVLLGGPLWVMRNDHRQIGSAEFVGIGLSIGLAALALVNLVARGYRLPLTLAPLALVPLAILARRGASTTSSITPVSNVDSLLLGFTPIFGFLPFSPEALPLSGALIVVLCFRRLWNWLANLRPEFLFVISMLPGLSAVVVYWITDLTPLWWDLIELDLIHDESVSYGLRDFGISSSPILAGEPVRSHLLPFSALGAAMALTDLPHFALVGAGGFAIATLGLSLTVFAFCSSATGYRSRGWLGVVMLLLQASIAPTIFLVPAMRASNAIGLLWFASAAVLFLNAVKRPALWDHLWIAAGFAVALLGKAPWGLLLLGFGAAVVVLTGVSSGFRAHHFSILVALLSLSVPAYLLFLRGAATVAFAPRIHLSLLVGLVPLVLLRLHLPSLALISLHSIPVRALMLTLLPLGVGLVLTGGTLNYSYFFNGSATLVALLVPSALTADLAVLRATLRTRLSFLVLAILGVGFGLLHLLVIGALRYGSDWRYGYLESTAYFNAIFVGVVLVLALVLLISHVRQRGQALLRAAMLLPLAISLGLFFGLITKPFVHLLAYGISDFPSAILTEDQIEVGRWLKLNTERDELLASNSLCHVDLKLGDLVPSEGTTRDCGDRNKNTWISALSHRRLLIEAPFFGPLSFRAVDDFRHVDDYNVSLRFGDTGEYASLEALRNRGVTWFVLDLSNSIDPSWIHQFNVSYSTASYVILDIAREGTR